MFEQSIESYHDNKEFRFIDPLLPLSYKTLLKQDQSREVNISLFNPENENDTAQMACIGIAY